MTGSSVATAATTGPKAAAGASALTALQGLSLMSLGGTAAKPAAVFEDLTFLQNLKTAVEAHGRAAEAFTLPLLPALLSKATLPVKSEAIKVAALAAADAIVAAVSPAAVQPVLLPILMPLTGTKEKWQTRAATLNIIATLPAVAGVEAVAPALVDVIPVLCDSICDARADVAGAAEKAFLNMCRACGNGDLDEVIPYIVNAMARPASTPETIHHLAATTFVKAVESPTIAVLTPLLLRGLQEREVKLKRLSCVIVENFCKLVMKREHAAPLAPLIPLLYRVREEVADAEVRAVAARSFGVLLKAADMDEATAVATYMPKVAAVPAKGKTPMGSAKATPTPKTGKATPAVEEPAVKTKLEEETEAVMVLIKDLVAKAADFASVTAASKSAGGAGETGADADAVFFAASVKHVATMVANMSLATMYDEKVWMDTIVPIMTPYVASPLVLETFAKELRAAVIEKNGGIKEESYTDDVDDGTPDLCKAEFSLAYGSKTLLNTATLHLKVGKKYGLIGPERCGKSTLLRAIANGQLEGFPSKDEVRTVYVDSTIKVEDADFPVLDFVLRDPDVISGGADRDTVISTLEALGFNPVMLSGIVGRLSGGWRCKLALARAQLSRSDIYLLDEPTNHLDVKNVNWLIEHLMSLTSTTCIIVSHDTAFVDTVCSHIVHFEGFKLRTYRGNLTHLVKIKPECKSYYELSSTAAAFHFPAPGFLEGVKTKDRAIIKVMDVDCGYPTRETPVVTNVTLCLSLSSRVVVLGANGAGKSTVIKTVVGELLPKRGSVWRHPNVRIAYVAQDAFHHLQDFQKHTPMEYVQWRYATGEDREQQEKVSTKVTADEEKLMAQQLTINGVKLTVSRVTNRRKSGRSYEYEVEFVGMTPDKNQWMPREWLTEHGWGKAVDAIDAREAAAAGLLARPLTAANIVAHYAAVGLDEEQVLHSRINTLSGGQLIKVVIGAAMWMNPHILIMDEPTNFLDRDALGALAAAIKEFDGGVVLITHHHDFTKELVSEIWNVQDGKCLTEGQSWDSAHVKSVAEADEVTDAAGNVIQIKKKLTGKLLKAHLKEKAARRKRGESVSSDDEDVE